MRYLFIIVALFPLLFAGCIQYARIEEVKEGMSTSAFLQLSTPHYFQEASENTVQYGCRFNVPYRQSISGRVVRPFLMTFEDGILKEIVLDEEERKRQLRRNQYYHGYGYGYRYRHHHLYGRPY